MNTIKLFALGIAAAFALSASPALADDKPAAEKKAEAKEKAAEKKAEAKEKAGEKKAEAKEKAAEKKAEAAK